MNKRIALASVLALMALSSTAFAGLKEDLVKEGTKARIAYQKDRWKKAFGSDVAVEVNWKALGDFCSTSNPEQQADMCRGEGVVGRGVDAMADIALSLAAPPAPELVRKAIKKKFKRIVVTKSASDKIEVAAAGDALTFKVPVGPKSDTSVDRQQSIAWRKAIQEAL